MKHRYASPIEASVDINSSRYANLGDLTYRTQDPADKITSWHIPLPSFSAGAQIAGAQCQKILEAKSQDDKSVYHLLQSGEEYSLVQQNMASDLM